MVRIFESRMLKKTFGSKGRNKRIVEKVAYWELHGLHSSSGIIKVMKLKGLRWWHMWHLWERSTYRVLVGKPKECDCVKKTKLGWNRKN